MTVKLTQQIPDNLTDEVCLCQIKMRSVPTWTAQKFERFAKFKQLARRKRYILYTADVGDHQLYGSSNSCRLDVPTNQKGALKRFGGNRIRLVCEVESQIARDILNPKGRSSSRWVGSLQFMEGYGKACTS